MNEYYKITCPNGKVMESTSLASLLEYNVVKIEDVLDYFNEVYGRVNTPCGEVYMGALMNSFLDEDEKYEFIEDYCADLAVGLLSDDWESGEDGKSYLEYEGFLIEKIQDDWLTKSSIITNRMEGEW